MPIAHNSDFGRVREYQNKLEAYVGSNKSKYIIEEALYVVSMGTNDFIENYYSSTSPRELQYMIEQFQGFIIDLAEDFIKQIYQLGARKILFTGLPPMGCFPLERAVDYANRVGSYRFKSKMAKTIELVNAKAFKHMQNIAPYKQLKPYGDSTNPSHNIHNSGKKTE